tara:strand:- start:4796 stop:5578 length:783 start_codon:yes stop_codon:yes gene_type:complete
MLKNNATCRNFFIVGAQKAGTTALHRYLSEHSEISISSTKELHFFDNETIDWKQPDYASLDSDLGGATKKVRGEATPIYMYWPKSIERLHAYDPSAKIIILLRHPVFRAHSHWRMETVRQAEDLPFYEAIRGGRSRVKKAENGVHRVHSYVERGLYTDQIKRILKYYPRSQVHFLTNDQLWLEPKTSLKNIEIFLSVDEELDPERKYIIAARTDTLDKIDGVDFTYLMDLFKDDIIKTEEITGIPLGKWLEINYREPVKE